MNPSEESKGQKRKRVQSPLRGGAKSIGLGVLLLLILFLVASFGGTDDAAIGEGGSSDNPNSGLGYESVSMKKASEMMAALDEEAGGNGKGSAYILLDVRTQEEYDEGHIPGAVLLPNETIGTEPLEEAVTDVLPDQSQKIFIYCRSGNRSKQAATKLANNGYTNIIECGGIRDWSGEIEK